MAIEQGALVAVIGVLDLGLWRTRPKARGVAGLIGKPVKIVSSVKGLPAKDVGKCGSGAFAFNPGVVSLFEIDEDQATVVGQGALMGMALSAIKALGLATLLMNVRFNGRISAPSICAAFGICNRANTKPDATHLKAF
ncbi:MAG: hypothetical protein HZC25_05000 [Rhodospirillales bacterium]|nr:hypothetical protein [Rhodospirillales bacterium]